VRDGYKRNKKANSGKRGTLVILLQLGCRYRSRTVIIIIIIIGIMLQ
jgi:hypothetical protein